MIQITDHQIHFTGKSYSYIMMIDGNGRLFHKYFGKKLKKGNLHLQPPGWHCWDVMETMLPSPDNSQPSEKTPEGFVQEIPGLDTQQMEYPGFGYLDLRTPAISVRTTDNPLVLDFHVADVHIEENVKSPMGLPGLRNTSKEAEQLVISMKDDELDLELDLIYTVFPEEDVFARRACLKNSADQQYLIEKMMSFSMDFPTGEDYEVLSFPGKWGNERRLQRLKLTQGTMILDSNRGGSSHCMNPFAVLCSKDTSEKTGEAFAAALEYSGNHQTVFEKDQYGIVRMQQGISEKGLFYPLQKGETLEVPESVIIYSDEGFGKMSRSCHDFIRRHILREDWAWKERPVLINNWEATYFNFDENKLLSLAEKAASLGIELFVLDDGWFGKRDTDQCSLGDWQVNENKLPSGLDGLAKKINAMGMQFGIWMEPEMINPDSNLFRTHPDWVIRTPYRKPALSRNQLILDLSKTEVQDFIINAVSSVLEGADISYLKWDMNRNMTDVGTDGLNFRYYLGFYRVLDTLMKRFPNVLFEGCSGGGGRFDLGILYYMPQIWTSDDTDALERVGIQYGTSFCYPISTMGSHVSAVPNHQTGRMTPIETRGTVASFGNLGYELDLEKLSETDCEEIRQQVAFYKKVRSIIMNGIYYRLTSPEKENDCAFELVSRDGSKVMVGFVRRFARPNELIPVIKLEGLDPSAVYLEQKTGICYDGDELMYAGVEIPVRQRDFDSGLLYLTRVDK